MIRHLFNVEPPDEEEEWAKLATQAVWLSRYQAKQIGKETGREIAKALSKIFGSSKK